MILPSSSTFFEHSNSSKLLIDPEISFLFFDKLILYQSRWRLKSGDCMILGLSLLSPRLRCPLLSLVEMMPLLLLLSPFLISHDLCSTRALLLHRSPSPHVSSSKQLSSASFNPAIIFLWASSVLAGIRGHYVALAPLDLHMALSTPSPFPSSSFQQRWSDFGSDIVPFCSSGGRIPPVSRTPRKGSYFFGLSFSSSLLQSDYYALFARIRISRLPLLPGSQLADFIFAHFDGGHDSTAAKVIIIANLGGLSS